jgi:hypothetical protein
MENAKIFDRKNQGMALWRLLTSKRYKKLIPRQRLPDTIQLFVAESNFTYAWHHWFAVALEVQGLDVRGQTLFLECHLKLWAG